ncbi:helix-turn-helix transcriptional regulator [Plantactinospora sp. S1510]|uniref:Helix-turn-helix transcriptional regulator n=1 Tax=Plantactinospora alkalitolerans TaxID=2789879 RepID=A0ABS0GR17_9ACTN|nr:helix-turn-helix transcriptional regulator [Plantactinospora alkalitolerans]MBF9128645.1 helix-turn-helix transcriptional regulator [Plantactinospora alkalitolerans]
MGAAVDLLVDELIEARTSRSMTQEEWAHRVRFSPTHVSSVETRHRPPTGDYVAAVDKAFQTGGAYTRLLVKLASFDTAPIWLRDWLEIEREAALLRWFEPAYVPGLLQTEAYARATLAGGRFTAEEIERHVASRLARQAILNQEVPPQLISVVDEAVLHRPVPDQAGLMREQVERIIELAALDHIQIQVVPATTGMYLGLAGQFIIAEMPDDKRIGYADNQLKAQIVDEAGEIARLARMWEVVRNHALPVKQSVELIKEVSRIWI